MPLRFCIITSFVALHILAIWTWSLSGPTPFTTTPALAFAILCLTILLVGMDIAVIRLIGAFICTLRMRNHPQLQAATDAWAQALAQHLVAHNIIPNDGQGVYWDNMRSLRHPILPRIGVWDHADSARALRAQVARAYFRHWWERVGFTRLDLDPLNLPALSAHAFLRAQANHLRSKTPLSTSARKWI